MESQSFLTINDQSISLSQALAYLRATGNLQPFLLKIIRQHLLETELQNNNNLEINPNIIEQAVIDFRMDNQLNDPDIFQEWLKKNGVSYPEFRNQITTKLKLDKLKAEIAAPKLEKYFHANQNSLAQVVISRIVVAELELAQNIKNKIQADSNQFTILASEHSLTDDRLLNGMMGIVRVGQLPEPIQQAVINAETNEIIGPIEIENRYALLRIDRYLPATLEGSLKWELQEQLFEQWMQEKAQNMTIKMHIE